MLRRMAEQSPAEDPDRPDTPPAPPPAPAGQGGAAMPPAPQQGYPQQQPGTPPAQQQQGVPLQQGPYQQGPYQQPYGQQPPPPPPPEYHQQYPQQYPPQQYEQPAQYEQQPPPPQYPPEQQYPPQQYPPPQPYPPEQYAPPPYPPQQGYPPEQYPQQGYQQQPYQPGPYDQQQYAPPPYEQYPPQGQHHPGQVPHEDYYDQQPPQQHAGGWAEPPPTPQSDQIGTPMPVPEGDSVFRRFRRIASEAAYLVGASGRMQRDVDNIATIRRPIAIMRRVGVLSPVTNGGTSTVTALLSTTLAAQRSDRVLAVDADPSGAELSRRLELSVGAGPIERVTLVRSEGTADAVRTTLAEAQGQGSRDVGLAVVDCPGGIFDEVGSELAGSGHCVVVVLPSVQHVAEYCLSQLDQLTPDGQDVLLNRGIIVITVVENVDPASVSWLVEAFRQRGMEPVVLPFDLHIAQSWPLYSEQLQSDTRRTVLELAARVVETVTRSAG